MQGRGEGRRWEGTGREAGHDHEERRVFRRKFSAECRASARHPAAPVQPHLPRLCAVLNQLVPRRTVQQRCGRGQWVGGPWGEQGSRACWRMRLEARRAAVTRRQADGLPAIRAHPHLPTGELKHPCCRPGASLTLERGAVRRRLLLAARLGVQVRHAAARVGQAGSGHLLAAPQDLGGRGEGSMGSYKAATLYL